MNWSPEAQQSWKWLQWMLQVNEEDVDPIQSLEQQIRGIGEWDEATARDRHSTGDADRISQNEHFYYAAAMMSRAAKTAIEEALAYAIEWGADAPLTWSSLPPEAADHWEAAHHVVTVVLQAWVVLWKDLADLQGQIPGSVNQRLEHWAGLADQAAQTVQGAAVTAWAQRR